MRLNFLMRAAAGVQQVCLRLDQVVAGIDQIRIERAVLDAGDKPDPAVDEHVEEAVAYSEPGTTPPRARTAAAMRLARDQEEHEPQAYDR
ncbi:MAG: hypothetical protein ABSB01_17850 [Streptosporangiaceae bacterium]